MKAATPRQIWLVSALLAVLFTAFQIQSSFHSGALSLPVTYDDVGYFNDALKRLEALYRDGGRAFLLTFWANPPHAPLQTLLTVFAFGLFGPQQWAGAAMNAVPLVIILRLVLGYACRMLPLPTSGILAAAILGFPLLGLLAIECRPDMLCALLTAAGGLIVAADPRWREGDRKTLAISAALLVAALLAKPTLVVITVAVFGTAAVFSIALHSRTKANAWRAAKMALLVGGICALVVLPYYIAVFQRLYEYVTVNAFGSQASVWAKNAATPNPAVYYLTGPGGKAAIGTPWLVLCGALLVVSVPILRWRATLAVFLVMLVAYAGVTMPSMKSPFLGLVVPALVLGIGVMLAISLLARLPQRFALAGAIALLVFSAITWRPVSLRLGGASVPATQAQNFQRIYAETADALATIPDLGQRRLYMPVIAQYLNLDNIEFEIRRRGLPVPVFDSPYHNADLDFHKKAIAQADVIVLFSDDSTLPLPWPASASIRKEITAAVQGFEVAATVDGGPYLGRVLVLKRK